MGSNGLEPHQGVKPICRVERESTSPVRSSGVDSELCEWYPEVPIVLEIRDVRPKVLFQVDIQPFGLAIGLGMVACKQDALDSQAAGQMLLELG